MIQVTKLNGEGFYVNPNEIEFIEETPDTVVSLKSGKKVLVAEKAERVIDLMVDFYRRVNRPAVVCPEPYTEEEPEQGQPEEG